MTHANWEDMNQYLYFYNFSHIFNSRDSEFIWEQLKVAIFNAINMFMPKVPTRNANQMVHSHYPTQSQVYSIPWEEGTRNIQQNWTSQKSTKQLLSYNWRWLRPSHHNKIYQYVSNIKTQDNFPTQMFYNNQHACNDQEKAQLFNNYFYSVFSTDSITPVNEPPTCLQVLAHWMATKHLALTILAPGYTDTVLYHY